MKRIVFVQVRAATDRRLASGSTRIVPHANGAGLVHRGLVIVSFLLIVDVVVLAIVREHWQDGWVSLRHDLLGPGVGLRGGFARIACSRGRGATRFLALLVAPVATPHRRTVAV